MLMCDRITFSAPQTHSYGRTGARVTRGEKRENILNKFIVSHALASTTRTNIISDLKKFIFMKFQRDKFKKKNAPTKGWTTETENKRRGM